VANRLGRGRRVLVFRAVREILEARATKDVLPARLPLPTTRYHFGGLVALFPSPLREIGLDVARSKRT
jgi:hypothetical protein